MCTSSCKVKYTSTWHVKTAYWGSNGPENKMGVCITGTISSPDECACRCQQEPATLLELIACCDCTSCKLLHVKVSQ